MKKIILFLIFTSLIYVGKSQNFHDLSFKNIDGNQVSANTFISKKVLFIIIPLSATDSLFTQLQAFRSRYDDTVKIVGIPSFEDGFQTSNSTTLKNLYNPLGIILTEGMYTKKSSPNQSVLAKWLTDKTKNRHFDADSKGIGSKFFVSGTGRLFAVMPPQTLLGSQIINRIVRSPNL